MLFYFNRQNQITGMTASRTNTPLSRETELFPGTDFLDLFVESGICGVPGEVFGDTKDHRMVRFSTGIEALAKEESLTSPS